MQHQVYMRIHLSLVHLILSIVLSIAPVNSQLLKDTVVLNLVKKDIDYIYNLQFDNAREVHSKINLLYPEHPVVILLNGMITYWENYPMLPTTPARDSFEKDMRRCIKLCEGTNNSDQVN